MVGFRIRSVRRLALSLASLAAIVVTFATSVSYGQPAPVAPAEPAATAKPPAAVLPANPFPRRIKAPPLDGAVAWINTAAPLDLRQLRGKFVMLDFWTYCCINCMHILPELKKLEHKYPNELVV